MQGGRRDMESKKVIQSAGVIGGFTLMSRGLGLVRDVLMAGFFGTSLVMSSFVVAFTIPNLFRRLFGEGALSSALVPVLVETREKEGDASAWRLVNRVFFLLAIVLTLLTVVVVLYVGRLSVASAKTASILSLLQIMMPYMIFICLAAVSMGILNSFHHFAVSAFAPCILNILWIGTLLLVVPQLGNAPEEKIRAVAWAILLAGFLQWAVQWPVLRRFGWRFHPKLGENRAATNVKVKRIFYLMGPAALGLAVTQLNVMIDRFLAMWVSAEAPSALFFSERLIYFPLGIFATALGTVLLPVFSGHAAHEHSQKIGDGLTDGLCHLLFIMTPAAVGLLILAHPIVQMIFEWKEFGAASTEMTAIALQCYASGLIIFSLAKITVPVYYALQDTRTPVKIGALAVILNLILNITFILTLPQAVKHAGIALATVLSETFSVWVLLGIIQRRIGGIDWRRVGGTAARTLGGAALMAAILLLIQGWVPTVEKTDQIISVIVSIIVGGGVYLLASFLVRAPEIHKILQAIRR